MMTMWEVKMTIIACQSFALMNEWDQKHEVRLKQGKSKSAFRLEQKLDCPLCVHDSGVTVHYLGT